MNLFCLLLDHDWLIKGVRVEYEQCSRCRKIRETFELNCELNRLFVQLIGLPGKRPRNEHGKPCGMGCHSAAEKASKMTGLPYDLLFKYSVAYVNDKFDD